jgi:hypothetical protein
MTIDTVSHATGESKLADRLCRCGGILYSAEDRVSSLCEPCRGDRLALRAMALGDQPLAEGLGRSLFFQGVELVGQLFWHVERGVTQDVLACYRRLIEAFGRRMSHEPMVTTLLPLSAIAMKDAVALFQIDVMPALRNCTHLDAERHWRGADAVIKGLAYAEARLWRERAEALKRLPPPAGDSDETDDARQVEIARQIAQSRHYLTLSVMEGWR